MKPITFPGSGMLAGIATMLELLGFETTDQRIAMEMEAPFLFTHSEEGYKTGKSLYTPQWLNLYLHSHGYHLTYETLPQQEVASFLRTHTPAMLRIKIKPGITHPAVFSGYASGKYSFVNIRTVSSDEPETISIGSSALLNRLEEKVDVYVLTACTPERTDFVPLLHDSLNNLNAYQDELLSIRHKEITLAEFKELRESLFRALMQDLQPLIYLIGDDELAEALRRLNHHYRHVFTQNSGETVCLDERLPKKLIILCIEWLKENIRDRIYALEETKATP